MREDECDAAKQHIIAELRLGAFVRECGPALPPALGSPARHLPDVLRWQSFFRHDLPRIHDPTKDVLQSATLDASEEGLQADSQGPRPLVVGQHNLFVDVATILEARSFSEAPPKAPDRSHDGPGARAERLLTAKHIFQGQVRLAGINLENVPCKVQDASARDTVKNRSPTR